MEYRQAFRSRNQDFVSTVKIGFYTVAAAKHSMELAFPLSQLNKAQGSHHKFRGATTSLHSRKAGLWSRAYHPPMRPRKLAHTPRICVTSLAVLGISSLRVSRTGPCLTSISGGSAGQK
jgi:hypothetical protein